MGEVAYFLQKIFYILAAYGYLCSSLRGCLYFKLFHISFVVLRFNFPVPAVDVAVPSAIEFTALDLDVKCRRCSYWEAVEFLGSLHVDESYLFRVLAYGFDDDCRLAPVVAGLTRAGCDGELADYSCFKLHISCFLGFGVLVDGCPGLNR